MNHLFAIGDIHGCFDSLKELIENQIQLTKKDKLVLLGDYIDRGQNSKGVIDYIINLQEKDFDIIPLVGNHEVLLLEALEDEKDKPKWIQNGGGETLKSFEIDSIKDIDPKYIEFFKNLPYYFSFEEFLFVHAGFNDQINDPFQDKYHMVWKCRENYEHVSLRDKTIVHGHSLILITTCDKRINSNKRVINLDTGCVYSDNNGYARLTALELNTKRIFFA